MQPLSEIARTFRLKPRAAFAAAMYLAFAAKPALSAEEAAAVHPPGLPSAVDWKFNFDGSLGAFGFANSLYLNPKPGQPIGNTSGNWFEGAVKPALSGVYETYGKQELYGKVSVVGESTWSGSPSLVGGDESSFDVEDLYIGWRSRNSIGHTEDMFELVGGRTQYKIGHGMLLWDGAAEGGSRGGYWTNARKAWKLAGIGRMRVGGNTFEAFYLEKDELPELDNNNQVSGVNWDFSFAENATIGASYFEWNADSMGAPQRDGLDVYDFRVFIPPFSGLKGFTFDFEYAKEDNGEVLDSYAWNALVGYQWSGSWKPRLTYRYAFFEGDNPNTVTNEGFDGLSTGFHDWGTWWQGEIAGEYFLANSNLISSQVRLHVTPSEALSTGIIFYDFELDNPAALAPGVTSNRAAYELDWYADWAVNKNLMLSFVAAYAEPGKAIEQATGRTRDLTYGMIYAAYSF